ncbi:MAG: hypothetical protein LBC46_06190 [Treponema sp.]|jgi:hypothetical protein|nr:hypothetical protein [Treponema sp.]
MKIIEITKTGKASSRVRFEDGSEEAVPNACAVVGKDYISAKMLTRHAEYARYEGEHILAQFNKGQVSIRNKDNICSATIARNQKTRNAAKVWCSFLSEVSRSDSFGAALDYFERHGINMLVSG